MNTSKSKSLAISLALSVVVSLTVAFLWNLSATFIIAVNELLMPPTAGFTWWEIPVLIILGFVVASVVEKFSVKRVLPSIVFYVIILFAASIAATKFLDINLLFIPVAITVLGTLMLVHLKKLWMIDSELTEKLVYLASTGHLLEGKPADLRIEGGLKLLETILPLSEAIVFRYTVDNGLDPVGRSRHKNGVDSGADRQSSWRENVEQCEEALKIRETIVQTDDIDNGAARIALPLIYEDVAIGVLFVKVAENFEQADTDLLEAFCGQLAQNFQRRELRGKSLPHQHWWSSFSSFSAENRLDIISLIHGIIKEQSFSAIASSNLTEAHAIAYLDGTLAYLNRQMRNLAQLGSQEFYQTDLFSLLERFRTDVFNEPSLAIRRVLQTSEPYRGELFFPTTNVTLKMQISLVKVPDDNISIHTSEVPMKPACFLITFRDISAVKENEKLRSDMASLMSHELRTPITSIQGFAEIMLADDGISADSKEFLTIIANESQRLSKMLSTFLSVSNLEQGDKKEVSKTTVKLDTVVHDVVNDYQERAKQKRIRLVEQPNPHLPPIAADKGLISSALSNLIDNAIRYSPERTSVIISTILESDFLRVVVEDRGFGIHSSEHEKVWEKFYRVARDGQDKEDESTGLGLSLVKEIVEQHGGLVEVESVVGHGSKFSIKLPRL